ncbi:hypothetical protein M5689_000549 [Euphorbia peplus]|nr:hypothetical protein M5689_000549 [Euphorbia peplus]
MAPLFLFRRWRRCRATTLTPTSTRIHGFRSDAALDNSREEEDNNITNLVLYNYPSFSGAFAALIAHRFLSRLNLSFLILPFSSVDPLRVEDLRFRALERCYLLDFLGPPRFAARLSQQSLCEVIGFDHRKSVLHRVSCMDECPERVKFHVDLEKSSSSAVYEYFSSKLVELKSPNGEDPGLLNAEDQDRFEMVLKYIEDVELHRWSLPDSRAFNTGLSEWRSKINCITNPFMYQELLEIYSTDLIVKGNSIISSHESSARKLIHKVFKVRLGKGFYGECLGVRTDGNSKLTDEIGRQLSVKSAAAGLRPIGAVVYMQRNNLKMCLRSTDSATDTSEVSRAYGGGGKPSSSSFIIRMDEYNQWLSDNAS